MVVPVKVPPEGVRVKLVTGPQFTVTPIQTLAVMVYVPFPLFIILDIDTLPLSQAKAPLAHKMDAIKDRANNNLVKMYLILLFFILLNHGN